MPKLTLATLCEAVITDATTNLISYINVLHGVTCASLPVILDRPIVLASTWEREEDGEKFELQVCVRTPNGKVLKPTEQMGPLVMEAPRHRVNISLGPLNLEQVGTYAFELRVKKKDRWRKVKAVSLEVERKTAPTKQ